MFADPAGKFLHGLILEACRTYGERIAIVDAGDGEAGFRRVSFADYGERIERLAAGLMAAGVRPGEVVAVYLPNSLEFALTYHAATLAGAVPTPLNPSYREREVRYQLENSGAVMLVTEGPLIHEMDLSGLPKLRQVVLRKGTAAGATRFSELLLARSGRSKPQSGSPAETLAALPYSSGTTGLPKGVMLSHSNLVTNVFQVLVPGEEATFRPGEVVLCFLPLYHIYGLNVILNPVLTAGGTLVLMPRFDLERACRMIGSEGVTWLPMVPPVMNAFCLAAEQGRFPKEHKVRSAKSGAAPLAPELPKRFTSLTGIRVRQGYGMTEASPVTHLGFLEPPLYRPQSIGTPVAETDCRLVQDGQEGPDYGELVMRGPQFMSGYWHAPEESAEVLRDGWYWSGDVGHRDPDGFYYIVDRRKEMIKYKGFAVAPAEVEAVLLEHPAVRDCGVVGRACPEAGEVPCAFIVLREGLSGDTKLEAGLAGYVAERLTSYKQPREVRFVGAIPRNPSGKILRRQLRELL